MLSLDWVRTVLSLSLSLLSLSSRFSRSTPLSPTCVMCPDVAAKEVEALIRRDSEELDMVTYRLDAARTKASEATAGTIITGAHKIHISISI